MCTLLLVDDFEPDRKLYRRYLLSDSNYAYQLLEAESAIAGLELCRTTTIDAILLDYSLPDLDGLLFLKSLHNQNQGSHPPVVMVTGEGDESIAVQAIKLGAEDYLVKHHLTPELLQLAMKTAIENTRLRSQLQQSEERYRYITRLIPQLVWIADPAGTLLDLNERWTTYTGLTLEQAQTQGWRAIVHPDDVPTLSQAWQAAQQDGTQYQAEGRMKRADGIYRWHLHQAMPLKNEQGQILKWFGTATDIQDLKQIEADNAQLLVEAETARQAAEAANRSKDEFVAMVAHELRSPLTSIAGWANLLQTRTVDEATLARALDTISRNTQAQVQLVEDLLDISRMVQGTLQIQLAPVNLSEVIEAALDVVRPMAEAKPIQLETQLGTTATVSGDFHRLQQIVVNLLTNAIKFTPKNGRVEIQLVQADSTTVQILVRDTGKGIAPEFLPMIFERYQQGQQPAGSQDGLGLGLAIVKHLVELHLGTITAESEGENRGATFIVQLPCDAI